MEGAKRQGGPGYARPSRIVGFSRFYDPPPRGRWSRRMARNPFALVTAVAEGRQLERARSARFIRNDMEYRSLTHNQVAHFRERGTTREPRLA